LSDRDKSSTPTTSTRFICPVWMNWSPMERRDEAGAGLEISNAGDVLRADLLLDVHRRGRHGESPVTVPTMIMSRSDARTLAFSSAARAALLAKSLVSSPSAAMRRSRMPVRSVIHASDVSTIRSRSTLLSTLTGA
jgi:hypothetical protein